MGHAGMSIRPEVPRVLGVVLAGGQSRRFGHGDKALATLGGKTVLDHVIERARPQVDHLILNMNGDRARFVRFGLEIVADETPGEGPFGGILAALAHASAGGFDMTATFPCDTPFFPRDLVARLGAALDAQEADFAIAASEGREHRVFALWRRQARASLAGAYAKGMRRLGDAAECLRACVVDFSPQDGESSFLNINRGEDLAEAEAFLVRTPGGVNGRA